MIFTSLRAQKYPNLPYAEMKEAILGKKYDLSLNFIGKKRALSLNKKHRKATYIPNVLSFPLTDAVGEIYICTEVARKEASKFSMTPDGYIGYLFIHGLLHLKGHLHGSTMEKAEKKYVTKYKLT